MARHTRPRRPEQVAEGVHRLSTGPGPLASNVYFVRSGRSFVLIDTGWPGNARLIEDTARELFGDGAHPAGILLTHDHPDHSGSARELAGDWGVPVGVPSADLPSAVGEERDDSGLPRPAGPLDRWVVLPMLRLLPRRRVEAMIAKTSLRGIARPIGPDGVPEPPGWRCVPTPGHTPGHVAFFRDADRVLITGDAVLTTDVNSPCGLLLGTPRISTPPWLATWDWPMARESVEILARLEPRVLTSGHGGAMSGPEVRSALWALAARGPARACAGRSLLRP